MAMKHRYTEIHYSYTNAALAQARLQAEGWEILEDDPPVDRGFNFEVVVHRDDEPKPTRGEILEKARAARAAKRKENEQV